MYSKSLAVMSGESEDTWEPFFHCRDSQLINQKQEQVQTVVTCIVQWVCHAINKSSICVFLPQRTSIFRPKFT